MIGNSLLNTVSGAVLINLLLTGSTMSLNSEWIVPFFFFFFFLPLPPLVDLLTLGLPVRFSGEFALHSVTKWIAPLAKGFA